jgi:hypothetical protein
MTCQSCTHSESRPSMRAGAVVLWCALHKRLAERACGDWCRYPGAEE